MNAAINVIMGISELFSRYKHTVGLCAGQVHFVKNIEFLTSQKIPGYAVRYFYPKGHKEKHESHKVIFINTL